MRYNHRMRRILPLLTCLAVLLLTLACNLPHSSQPVSPDVVLAVRQTLTAQAVLLQTVVVIPGEMQTTPVPGASPVPGQTQPAPQATLVLLDTPTPNPNAFLGLRTPQPGQWLPRSSDPGASLDYITQPGDTRAALALRFGLGPGALGDLPDGLLPAGQRLQISNPLGSLPYADALLPDSQVVNSPTAAGFDIAGYVAQAGGYLANHSEMIGDKPMTGAQMVQHHAIDNSISPRLLLAVIEYETGWVFGPQGEVDLRHPLGFNDPDMTGLYNEIALACQHLGQGYYGWRDGSRVNILFQGGGSLHPSPALNAGTLALLNTFAALYDQPGMEAALYAPDGFLAVYQRMFGDPWADAALFEPFLPHDLQQPAWELPYAAGTAWHLTSGPHMSWTVGSPRGALDFAPPKTDSQRCRVSSEWVTAAAPGLVVRSERGQVLVDLDGDGYEHTGWVVLYMHIASQERAAPGTWLQTNDPVGHASCEGGYSTGTHVHIARKYNGEWIAASGALPFSLSGWQAATGDAPYGGSLTRDGVTIANLPFGSVRNLVPR